MVAAAILNFKKKVNISELDEYSSTKFDGQMRHGHNGDDSR